VIFNCQFGNDEILATPFRSVEFLLKACQIPSPLEFFKLRVTDAFSMNSLLSNVNSDNIKMSVKLYLEFARSVLQAIIPSNTSSQGDDAIYNGLRMLAYGFGKISLDVEFDDVEKFLQDVVVPYVFGTDPGQETVKFSFAEFHKRVLAPIIAVVMVFGEKATEIDPDHIEDESLPDLYRRFFNLFASDGDVPEIVFYFGDESLIRISLSRLSLLSIFPNKQALRSVMLWVKEQKSDPKALSALMSFMGQ